MQDCSSPQYKVGNIMRFGGGVGYVFVLPTEKKSGLRTGAVPWFSVKKFMKKKEIGPRGSPTPNLQWIKFSLQCIDTA